MQNTKSRFLISVLALIAVLLCIITFSCFFGLRAIAATEAVHVPGGTVTDVESFSEALGGRVFITDDSEVILSRDVILDAPLVIRSGEYVFDGAGCKLIRGFERGDLIVVENEVKLKIGRKYKEGSDLSLVITGGVTSTLAERTVFSFTITEDDLNIDPEQVTGALLRVKDNAMVIQYSGTELRNNHSQESGAGVICDGGTFIVENGTVSGCSTNLDGGNILVINEGTFSFKNGTVFGGYALQNGGNLANMSTGNVIFIAGTISAGFAQNGGGIYAAGGSFDTQALVNITSNVAIYGGGIYFAAPSDLVGVSISSNVAEQGGGIYNSSNDLTLTDLQISENTAQLGGGIYNAGNISYKNVKTGKCVAESKGGGLYNAEDAVFEMNQGTLNDSEAPIGGGVFNAGTFIAYNGAIAINRGEVGSGVLNDGVFQMYKNMLVSNSNAFFLVLSETGKGSLELMESVTAAKYPLLVPGMRNEDGTYSENYGTKAALLTGNAEAIRDAAKKFSVAAKGTTRYSLTEDGVLQIQHNWLLPVVVGTVSIAVIVACIVILYRFRKNQRKAK